MRESTSVLNSLAEAYARLNTKRFLVECFLLSLCSEIIDVLSSLTCTHFSPACSESNSIFADQNGMFLWEPAVALKFWWVIAFEVVYSALIYRLSKQWVLAALPFIYGFVTLYRTDIDNFAVIIRGFFR